MMNWCLVWFLLQFASTFCYWNISFFFIWVFVCNHSFIYFNYLVIYYTSSDRFLSLIYSSLLSSYFPMFSLPLSYFKELNLWIYLLFLLIERNKVACYYETMNYIQWNLDLSFLDVSLSEKYHSISRSPEQIIFKLWKLNLYQSFLDLSFSWNYW